MLQKDRENQGIYAFSGSLWMSLDDEMVAGRELNPRHADFQPLRPIPGNSVQKGTFCGCSKGYTAKSAECASQNFHRKRAKNGT
jgi:hypothetical protein